MVKLTMEIVVATQQGPKEVCVTVESKTLPEAKAKVNQFIDSDLQDYHILDKYIKQITYT